MHRISAFLLLSTWIFLFNIVSGLECSRGGYNNNQPQFGPGCSYRCHCVADAQCDSDTGTCQGGCAAGWMGLGCQYGDIAFQKTAWQSSNTGSEKVVDGDPYTCSEINQTGEKWWRVDLNALYKITGLVISSNSPDVLKGFGVRVGNVSADSSADFHSTCFNHSVNENVSEITPVLCTSELVGKHLMITIPGLQTKMKLCDVRVYGGRTLAYRRFTKQSTVDWNGVASRAVDGGTNTDYNGGNTCTHTAEETSPWWMVDLEHVYYISRIEIFSRQDCCTANLAGLSISFARNGSFARVYEHPNVTPGKITEVTNMSSDTARIIQIEFTNTSLRVLTLCEVFIYGDCPDNLCGWSCESPCFCANPVDKMNKIDGYCPGGCAENWTGSKCNLCYVDRDDVCVNICGKCRQGTLCNASDGTCVDGCQPGWWNLSCRSECNYCNKCTQLDGICSECSIGKWGPYCLNNCTNCRVATGCSISNGICLEGCLLGRFGVNCDKLCGHCGGDGSCERDSGRCNNGCLPGWMNNTCNNECPSGWFGVNCGKKCGNCANNSSCHRNNGTCIDGCSPGYTVSTCEKVCSSGYFGLHCSQRCYHCVDDSTCHHVNGTCLNGCDSGYIGPMCDMDCSLGTYGVNCSNICGHCANITCDHIFGTCYLGCLEGYYGKRCSDDQEETSTESSSTLPIGIPVGGALGAVGLTIMIIVLALFYWKRRKRAAETPEIDHTYDQIDTTRALHEKLSDYSKIEELGLSPVIPKENTYENTLSEKNLIPKCEFRDIYQHFISIDDKTGDLRLLSVFNSIPTFAPTKTDVTRSGRADDCIETLNKSYLFGTKGKKEFTILCDFPTTSEAIWRLSLEHKIHLIIIIGENRIPLKPKVQIDIGFIQIECIDIIVERDCLLCNINVSESEKDTKMRNVQVILSIEDCSFCIPPNIDETLAVLKKRLWLRQGIEAFNTLINCTPNAMDGECFLASLLMTDFMERSGYIDIRGIIEAMRKEKHDAISSFDKFKFCHDVIFKWIVDEENARRM